MAKSNFDKFINKPVAGAKKKEQLKQAKKKFKKEREEFFIEKKRADRAAKKLAMGQDPQAARPYPRRDRPETGKAFVKKGAPARKPQGGYTSFAKPKTELPPVADRAKADKPLQPTPPAQPLQPRIAKPELRRPKDTPARKTEGKPAHKKPFDPKKAGKPELIKGVPFERRPLKTATIPIVNNAPAPKKPVAKDKEAEKTEDTSMALNKFLAHGGVSSRRDAGELVKSGKVKINGTVVNEPGYKVQAGDEVSVGGKKIVPMKNLVYILLNKPKDFITTVEDPQGRKTVLDIVAKATTERVYPVGRLDRNTSGVLLITNDGELAQRLTHPSFEVRKIYEVKLDKPLVKADFEKIIAGVTLEDGPISVDSVAYADPKDKSIVGVEIHSGRNRIVRRLFEHLGYDVKALDRVMFANLTKKNVDRGKWRLLTEKEVRQLKYFNKSKMQE